MAFGLSAGAVAAIGSVAAPVIGGMISGNAAGDAASIQAAATDRANALTQAQFDQTRSDLAPWRTSGSAANTRLMQLLGLGGGSTGGMTADQARAQLLPQYTKTVTTPGEMVYQSGSGEANGGWVRGADTSSSSVDENGLSSAIAQLMAQNPGTNPQGADYGSLLKPFTGADLQNEPGYQFALQQGQQGLDRKAQAAGSYFSGAALKEAARYGNDYASTKYGDAFNRDASTKQQTYNFLSGTSSAGQNAANMTSNAGAQAAGTIGANTTALGNAQGAAGIAGANALSGGINGAVGNVQQQQLIDAYNQRNALQRAITGGNTGFGTGSSYGNQDLGQYF